MPNEKPPARPPAKNKKGIVQANAESRSTKKAASKKSAEKPRQVIESSKAAESVATEAPITRSMEKSATMKMGVQPDAVRELAETAVEQAERAVDALLSAAHQSVVMIPNPATEMSKKTLALTEQNMKVVFDYARKLLHAKDLQEVMQIQAQFFKRLLPKSK